MGMMASQIISVSIVYSTVCWGTTDQRIYRSLPSLAFVRGIHWWPVDSPHKGPVTRKMFPFDDRIMWIQQKSCYNMMMSWHANAFHIFVPLCGESTGHWWIPLQKASNEYLCSFLRMLTRTNCWKISWDTCDLKWDLLHLLVCILSTE